MKYIDFKGKSISMLGYGAMRFPTLGKDSEIDYAETEKLLDRAMEAGINYFDTAYPYHGGNSEIVLGKILSKYPRDSYYIATKYPGHQVLPDYNPAPIFEKQLEKCGVEYFDFYLLHNVAETSISTYLDDSLGIIDYFLEQKRRGRIKHLGFSTHASPQALREFLDAKGEYMEFCQIQLNYLDWTLQRAKEKCDILAEWNIPVWVMEPVRGGKLCNLDEKYAEQLRAMAPDRTLPQWAFRFIQGIPEVKVTLSGMSDLQQLRENIETFETCEPLNAEETKLILSVAKEMRAVGTLPCTSCRYCLDYCPQALNIPWIIELYNEQKYKGGEFRVSSSLLSQPEDKRPTACIGCGACESVCPQNIKISEMMADFASKMK